jgi:hypothetical protein
MIRSVVIAGVITALLAALSNCGSIRAQSRDQGYFTYPSPDEKWLLLESIESGRLFVQPAAGGDKYRLRSGFMIPRGHYSRPWSRDGRKLAVLDIPSPGHTQFLFFAPNTKTEQQSKVEGVPSGSVPLLFSPDGRYVACGLDISGIPLITMLLVLETTGKQPFHWVVPFRHSVTKIAWADDTHLFVVTSGSELGSGNRKSEEAFYLDATPLGNSRPVGLGPSVQIEGLAQYADAKGDIVMVVREEERYSVAHWNPNRSQLEETATLGPRTIPGTRPS